MAKLKLTIAFDKYDYLEPLRSGEVQAQGIDQGNIAVFLQGQGQVQLAAALKGVAKAIQDPLRRHGKGGIKTLPAVGFFRSIGPLRPEWWTSDPRC